METMKMEDEVWMIDKHLCRCCHLEGKFKSLASTDLLMENKMLFKDALRFGLDIELCPVEGPLADAVCTICESCVERLREACSFRNQVLKCEERFQYLYSEDLIKVASSEPVVEKVIKQELPDPEDSDNEGNHDEGMDKSIDEAGSDTSTDPPKVVESKLFELLTEWPDGSKPITPQVPKKRGPYRKCRTAAVEAKQIKIEKPAKVKKPKTPSGKKRPYRRRRPPTPPIDELLDDKEVQIGGKNKPNKYRLRASYDYEQTGDQFKCTRCFKTYNSFKSISAHVRRVHKPYNCDFCNTPFYTINSFIKHKYDVHKIDDRYKCNACDRVFNSTVLLREHKNIFHMLGAKRKCPQCDFECFGRPTLYKHQIKHKTVKDYNCKYCKKSFLRKTTLAFHERIHTGDKRKVCAECGQAFVQKASLNYHMMKYHPSVKF